MKQTTKRFTSILLGLIFFMGAIIIYFELVQQAYDDSQTKKGQYQAEKLSLENEKSTITQVQDLIKKYQSQEGTQRGVNLALPTTKDISGAIAQITGMAARNVLLVQNISVTNSAIPQKSATPGAASSTASFSSSLQKPIGTVLLRMKLTGGYANFKQFVNFLETNIRIFDVSAISIQQPGKTTLLGGKEKATEDNFTYDITTTAYYQGQ